MIWLIFIFRERKEEREKNTDVRQKHRWITSLTWLGIEPATWNLGMGPDWKSNPKFLVYGATLSHTGQSDMIHDIYLKFFRKREKQIKPMAKKIQ